MATYAVMETKTGVILVEGSYDYCKTWIENNCRYNEKYGCWKDADREQVSIVVV